VNCQQRRRSISKFASISLITISLLFAGCASIPKEVVELSYRTGQDLRSIQESYDRLIHVFYEQLRAQRLRYLEDEWTPLFIQTWLKDGKLVEVARGEVVWSEEKEEFVIPSPEEKEGKLLYTVQTWAEQAVFEIEAKKSKLLGPLYAEEDSLRFSVSEAINQLIQANATVTAHLNSLRKVQEVQDDALSALGIKDLRDSINNSLASASHRASVALEGIRKADRFVTKVEKELNKTSVNGGSE